MDCRDFFEVFRKTLDIFSRSQHVLLYSQVPICVISLNTPYTIHRARSPNTEI